MAAFLTRLNVNRIPLSQRYVRNDISWKTILFLWKLWFGNIWTNTNSIPFNQIWWKLNFTQRYKRNSMQHINSNAWKIVKDGKGNTINNIHLQRFDIRHDKLNLRKKWISYRNQTSDCLSKFDVYFFWWPIKWSAVTNWL